MINGSFFSYPLVQVSFRLEWISEGNKSTQYQQDVVTFESGNISTPTCKNKQIILVWDSPPQCVCILTKPNCKRVHDLCKEMIVWLHSVSLSIYVEPRVRREMLADDLSMTFLHTWDSDEELCFLHNKIDLIVTLGGDGTVLWAASLFRGPVPPVVSFAMGSLGFMTPFQSESYRECLLSVMKGPAYITIRHRLHCRIIRHSSSSKSRKKQAGEEVYIVLNEVAIDRGMSSFLTNLECYCDNIFVTNVQGDGLILSTPSGSTAYSLSAGGSMVHPQVAAMLFTPICPHSLSFRPLILPEHVTLRVQVPEKSRGDAWVSFDGRERLQLGCGDALVCHLSSWPVPTACTLESTNAFLEGVKEGLYWNMRKLQGGKDIRLNI
ncbi:hypothetical protein SELMODRAFT_76799 [Selaginella moellendorffii]|uniref:NAD(+) kinase n=1 Tax=Selaginella moellendorffii TaxID=88036 RepID=D8QSR4_SELML|nr:hypothetical protein SELMODRAFT_76799 [Selaginella moellendorffii]